MTSPCLTIRSPESLSCLVALTGREIGSTVEYTPSNEDIRLSPVI